MEVILWSAALLGFVLLVWSFIKEDLSWVHDPNMPKDWPTDNRTREGVPYYICSARKPKPSWAKGAWIHYDTKVVDFEGNQVVSKCKACGDTILSTRM